MPLDLTDAELATAATACRAMTYQEGKRAQAIENPTMRGPVENAAKRFAVLAEKLEAAEEMSDSAAFRAAFSFLNIYCAESPQAMSSSTRRFPGSRSVLYLN